MTKPNGAEPLPADTVAFAQRMFGAARAGDDETLGQAVRAGLPPSLTNESGNTLLMLAAYSGHASTVELLISLGADPNRLNDRNQSPLAGAIFKAHDPVVRALFSGKADPRAGSPNAIDSAFMFGQRQYFELFGVTEADVTPGAPAPPSVVRERLERAGQGGGE